MTTNRITAPYVPLPRRWYERPPENETPIEFEMNQLALIHELLLEADSSLRDSLIESYKVKHVNADKYRNEVRHIRRNLLKTMIDDTKNNYIKLSQSK